MAGVYSAHWDHILEVLSEGPIIDPAGLATDKLRVLTGHESTNSLAKLLRRMEMAGLIVRDVNGRRTTRIALADDAPKVGRRRPQRPEAPAPAPEGDGFDYDLLASALLAKALKATEAQEQSAGAKDAAARAQRAEAALKIAEADAKAARARVAELEATVRQMEKNLVAIQAQLDKPAARRGDTIRERLSAQERRELDALMRALPAARG